MSSKPYSLAIVGGGISGLTLAITLLKYDIPFTIYEAAPNFAEIGAGVALGPNAGRAMELMSPKIFDAFMKCKTGNATNKDSWFTIRVGDARKAAEDGFVKSGKKLGDALFDVPLTSGGGRGGVYRAAFLDELVKAVPNERARFNKRLEKMEEATDGSGDMVLTFQDGSSAQHSAVIGCDGIKAKTRSWLLGEDDPAATAVFSGKYAYRGLIPMDEATELLGADVAQNSQIFMGYHGHLLTFPVQHGKTMNVVAFNSRDSWDNDKWVVSTSKEEMEADFAEWGPHVKKIVGAMQKPDVWALFMHPPCHTYTKGRVCLTGDAAHATTPHQGAGAGMCIEDSYILANLIKETNSIADLEKAFKVFDTVRRERTQRLVKTSHEAGQLYDFELFADDLEKIEESFLSRMGWIWDFDIEKQSKDAVNMFHGHEQDRAQL